MKKDDDKPYSTLSDQKQIDEKTRYSLFSAQGQHVKCQFCESEVVTTIEYKNTILGYILCLLAVVIFGLYGIAISLFIFPLCRSADHRCPKCYNLIISNHFLGLPSLQDQVITLNIGNCAILITRKILLILFVTCLAFVVLILILRHKIASFPNLEPTISDITWDDYRANCGILAFLGNPRGAWNKFMKDYKYANVNWSGYVARMTVNVNNHDGADDHSCAIYLKMVPDDFENGISLVIMLDKELYDLYKDDLATIEIGSKIAFNATLVGMGTDRDLPHLHGLGVKPLGEKIKIPGDLSFFGRYGPAENRS